MPERRVLGRRAAALLSAAALIFMQLPHGPAAVAAPSQQLRRYPYLTDVVGPYATINWGTTSSITTGEVRYGIVGVESCTAHSVAAGAPVNVTIGSITIKQFKAQLTLQPNTLYCYRVFGGSPPADMLGTDPSPEFWTQLPTGSTQPYTFAVFGDWGEAINGTNPWQANLMSRLAVSGARFALTTGDNAYPSGSQINYGDLVQTGAGVSAVFGPQFWAVPGRSMPLFLSMGNHGMSQNPAAHPHVVNWPQDRAVSTSGGRNQVVTYCCLNNTNQAQYPATWYAFDAGIARFYVLNATWANSNVGTADLYKNDYDYHWAPGSAQRQWLEADLAAHPSALKFAFFHFPIYSDEAHETSDPYLQGAASLEGLLASYGVDIAFTGHAHIYQRNFDPGDNGLVTYVTGGGGADVQSIGSAGCTAIDAYGRGFSDSSGTGNKCGTGAVPSQRDQVFHYLLVSVNGSQVTVTPTDSLGNTFDVVTYDFGQAPPPDTEAPTVPSGLAATSVTATQVDLAWNASTDNVAVTAYDILRDGAPLATVSGTTLAYSDTFVGAGTTYRYAVRARDPAGNASAYSSPELVVSTPAPPAGETLTFIATDDASLRSDKPTKNYGLLTTIQADGSPDRDLMLRFAVAGVNGRQVDRATLRLYGVDPSSVGGTFATAATTWTESTVTWANAPPAGATVGSIGAVAAGNWYELDVTSIVSDDGVISLRATSASTNGVDYASRQAVAAQQPQLVLEVSTPGPPDTAAPSVPGNLHTTSVTAAQVGLAWNAAIDNVAVTGYELTRNGLPHVALDGTTTSYTDTVEPETTYVYAVRATDAAGNASAYSSPGLEVVTPAPVAYPVLIGAGDIADCGGTNDEATAQLLGTSGTIFTAGDNAYPLGSTDDFANCYGASWGQPSLLARTRPAAGNHDYMTPGASAYFGYFGAAAGDPATGYYSYDLDTWHIVVLNSNCVEVGGCGAGSTQEQWLRADLAATPLDNIAAIWHHPRYTSGGHGPTLETQDLWQALYDHGAELVIGAHDHLYERFAPLDSVGSTGSAYGIRQFVVGTGGGELDILPAPSAHSEALASVFGVLKLTLRPDGYDWNFLAAPGSTFTDAGSAAVHAAPPADAGPPSAPTVTAAPVSPTRIDLTWPVPADDVGVIGYEVERDGGVIATPGAGATSYADTSLLPGQTYTYRVRARDGAGNWSAWSAPASATTPMPPSTLTFTATDDATIRPDKPTSNYGADRTLLVDSSSEKDFMVKFIVSGTGGQTVTSARLRLHALNPSDLGGEFYQVSASPAWSESTVTWNNAPAVIAPPLATLGPVAINTWYEVDLTGFVTGDGTYSLRISSPSTDGADYSSSEGTAGLAPTLVLSFGGQAALPIRAAL